MKSVSNHGFKLATASLLAISALGAMLAPATASAAIVAGTATITIDNTALSTSSINVGGGYPNGWFVDKFWDATYNTSGIDVSAPGGVVVSHTGSTAMSFNVNTNASTISYPSAGTYGRTVQATSMDASNTSSGQIGLSGGWLLVSPGGSGVLTPYDFSLTKTGSTWNIRTFDTAFSFQNFLKLTNVSESLNGSGQLLLSGDLQWTGLWAGLVGANTNTVVGHFSLAPAAVPVPAAVWMFASGLLGLLGVSRKKSVVAA